MIWILTGLCGQVRMICGLYLGNGLVVAQHGFWQELTFFATLRCALRCTLSPTTVQTMSSLGSRVFLRPNFFSLLRKWYPRFTVLDEMVGTSTSADRFSQSSSALSFCLLILNMCFWRTNSIKWYKWYNESKLNSTMTVITTASPRKKNDHMNDKKFWANGKTPGWTLKRPKARTRGLNIWIGTPKSVSQMPNFLSNGHVRTYDVINGE